jgi:hypothetical protein
MEAMKSNLFRSENCIENGVHYNGYIFGGEIVYNPWSILNFISSRDNLLEPYWINTSSNDIIRDLISQASSSVQRELEALMQGVSIKRNLVETISFGELGQDEDSLWSFLVFSGYLKAKFSKREGKYNYYELSIPNLEVEYLYETIISSWLEGSFENHKLNDLLKFFVEGDVEGFELLLQDFVVSMLSYYDTAGRDPERVYQAFVLGLLVNLQNNYEIKSNRESGYGRYDVLVIPKNTSKKGIIIEFKKILALKEETKDIALKKALTQIEEKNYAQELLDRGVKDILKLGIVFDGKRVWVKEGK